MQKILALLAVMLFIGNVAAQNKVSFTVKDNASKLPLSGVNIQCKNIFTNTNDNGSAVFDDLSDGWQVFTFTMKGYVTITDRIANNYLTDFIMFYLMTNLKKKGIKYLNHITTNF
jgi:hypothetical protein